MFSSQSMVLYLTILISKVSNQQQKMKSPKAQKSHFKTQSKTDHTRRCALHCCTFLIELRSHDFTLTSWLNDILISIRSDLQLTAEEIAWWNKSSSFTHFCLRIPSSPIEYRSPPNVNNWLSFASWIWKLTSKTQKIRRQLLDVPESCVSRRCSGQLDCQKQSSTELH